ncbi:MAG: hypothetical protein RLZZ127_2768 [Planctomycetota bacterium]
MAGREVIDGTLTTRGKARLRGLLLALPGGLWLLAFLLLPMLALVGYAFAGRDEFGNVIWVFTWENLQAAMGYDPVGALTPDPSDDWTPHHLQILGWSFWVAGVTTILCLLIAFPLCFWIAARPARWRPVLLALVLLPSFVNLVIRVSAWELLLKHDLFPAQAAQWLGLVGPGMSLYPSSFAVYVAMVAAMLPFTVLPLYTSVERLDWSIVEAARDCYAGAWRTFRHAILSQVTPGLGAAAILTFVPTLGMFLITDRLGGSKMSLVANLVAQKFKAVDFPQGAALGLVLVGISLLAVLAFTWLSGRAGRPEAR